MVSLEGALRSAGARYEVVAASLGAATDDGVPPGHPAAGAARPGLGRGAVLRPGARRVRRDDHLRRQPAGRHPHAAARDLPARETDPDAAVALSLVLVVVAVAGDRASPGRDGAPGDASS